MINKKFKNLLSNHMKKIYVYGVLVSFLFLFLMFLNSCGVNDYNIPELYPGYVKGTVMGSISNKPIDSVFVILNYNLKDSIQTLTSNGEYFISNIPIGKGNTIKGHLTYIKYGYQSKDSAFSLKPFDTLKYSIRLIIKSFNLNISSNSAESGKVTSSGSGLYNEGTSVTVTATPNSGYTFTNWTENGTIVSTNASYTFIIKSSRTLIANFSLFSPPGATSATSLTQTSFIANWGSVSGATGYYLDVANDTNFTSSSCVIGYNNKNVSNLTSYPVTGLTAGTIYYYRVRSYNASNSSSNSNIITVMISPIAISATNLTQTSFRAHWVSVKGATGYNLDVSTDNNFTSFVTGYNNNHVSNLTSYPVTGLMAGTIYYYRVRYYNTVDTSGNSNTITTTLPNVLNPPVAKPATDLTQASFTANWESVIGATGYNLDVATDDSFTQPVSGFSSKDVSNLTSYPVTGLTTGTIYYYRVRSYNSGGTSGNSNIINLKTNP